MQQLDQLTREAAALAAGVTPEAEVARQMQICNACRYCESFCAVFPAMTRRLEFGIADVHYLANLCHNCGACLHACQYAPPHEFAVNVPRAMSQVRVKTYEEYAWPRPFAAAYRSNGATVAAVTAIALALFLLLAIQLEGHLVGEPLAGNFYAVFPHNLMAAIFGAVFLFAAVALGIGARRFWRGEAPRVDVVPAKGAAAEAIRNVLTLKYLDGGHGDGCNDRDDRFTLWRRRMHHFTFYGFMLCFAATSVATLYHYLFAWHAPYALVSLPVILGTLGGIGLLIGPAGLLWLNLNRSKLHGDPAQRPMDVAFIGLLFFTSLTGLLLLVLRNTGAMPLLLAVHLGMVLALFALLPYGKFAHAVYRSAALLKYAIERRQPNRLQLERTEMPYVITFVDDPETDKEKKSALRSIHVEYVTRNADRIIASGGLFPDTDDFPNGGLIILDVEERKDAVAYIENDPFFLNGIFSTYTIHRWRKFIFDHRRVPPAV